MEKQPHQPLPWTERDRHIVDANGEPVRLSGFSLSCGSVPSNDLCHANDDLIVQAVNSHCEANEYTKQLRGAVLVMRSMIMAAKHAIESADLNGAVLWVQEPYCPPGIHITASDVLDMALDSSEVWEQ